MVPTSIFKFLKKSFSQSFFVMSMWFLILVCNSRTETHRKLVLVPKVHIFKTKNELDVRLPCFRI